MKKLLLFFLLTALSLGASAIGSPSDFRTITTAAELRQMSATGMTNAQPTQAQIAGFIKNNPTDYFNENIKTVYSSQGSIKNPYSPFSLYSSVIEDGVRELNIARYIAGVSCHITTTDDYNQVAARAAMICAANQSISHTPDKPSDMDEATYKDAYYACYQSNLGSGYLNLAEAVVLGWLHDGGLENISHVGHRLWCLSPNLEQVGFGMAKNGNCHYCAQHVKSRSQKLSTYDTNITVAWPAVNTPYDEIRSGTPFSFFIQSDALKVQFGSEVSVYMLDRKTNRLYTWHIKQGSLKNSDGLAFVNDQNAGVKAVIWRPQGWENHSFKAGDEMDVYIAGYYVDGKPYPIKYTIRFFDPKKVTPDTNTAAGEPDYKKKAAKQTLFIHGWDRTILTTSYRSHTFDLSECIFTRGHYLVQFQYSKGGNMLRLKNAVFKVDGRTVATFPNEVTAGNSPKLFKFEFDITSDPKQSVTLTADICGDGGINSEGTIQVSRKGDPTGAAPSSTGSTQSASASTSASATSPKADLNWKAGDFTTCYQEKEWDLSKFISQSGNYSITFTFTSGGCMLAMKNAKIVVRGAWIATFPEEVTAGNNPRSWTYTFNSYTSPKDIKLVADVRTVGGTNSNGSISIVRNGYTKETGSFAAITRSNASSTAVASTTSASSSTSSSKSTSSSTTSSSSSNTFNSSFASNRSLSSKQTSQTNLTSRTSATTASSSTSYSSSSSAKGIWEKSDKPVSVPAQTITYNKGAMNQPSTVKSEVVLFKNTPQTAEYTTGNIKRRQEYLQRYPYPTNKDAQTVNASASRNHKISNGVLTIADGTTVIYKNAFKGRTDITKVILPGSLKVIGDYAFANMPNLQTVESTERNSYKSVRYIGDHAFDQDTRLTTFPEFSDLEYLGVCSFREVGLEKTRLQAYFVADSAFIGSALKEIGWMSIIAIGDYAFKDCRQLSEWKFNDNMYLEYIGHGAFLGTNIKEVDLREGICVGMQAFDPYTAVTWLLQRQISSGYDPALYAESTDVPKMTRENYFKVMSDINDFSIYLPEGYDPVKSVDVPLVLFLHGRSMSQDLPAAPEYGPAIAMRDGHHIFHDKQVLLVCPSAVSKEGWSAAKLHRLYEFLKAHYAFNHKQFYVVGLSMGGWGTMNYVNRYPDEVAACVAICGGCDATNPCGLNKVPTWIIHAKDDDQTSVECSDRVVKAMKQCGSTDLLQYSRLEEGGHSLIYFFTYSNFYDWLFSHTNDCRQFNRSIDFVNHPDFDIDEKHYGLYTEVTQILAEDIDITPARLSEIKQRQPSPQRK